jgi:hypothetical protein
MGRSGDPSLKISGPPPWPFLSSNESYSPIFDWHLVGSQEEAAYAP